ncbi:putative porin [Elizabethkingia sp. JS20170427COW]|uniref:putative porin n=1 Tax=Elizabethkingia sp. JS20170427COW TaxID=2583851 RepID=UPI00111031D2|nr:putative porin [Elizabethkingia sp. JS20170427COW]QCX52964.1 hypothetical protein FGE20_04025 [Elizabethkingia sp. JS20170427COW]
MKYIFLGLVCGSSLATAQVVNKTDTNRTDADSVVINNGNQDSVKIFKPTINDYRFKTQRGDYKVFDTVFNAQKTFVFSQFNNKDNFGKVQFPNVGSRFNPMAYEQNAQQNLAVLPTGKSFNIISADEIKYYDVKTPTTSFIYHNSVSTGAVLHSQYTQNIGKNFNFAINYMGLRSKGVYQRDLAVNNNFNLAMHYLSKSGRYEAYAHYLNQNVNNEENGGIKDLNQFLGGDSRFNNRQNLEINLQNSQSQFNYRRYYIDHRYGLFAIDGKFPLKLRHLLSYELNKYYFDQTNTEAYYVTSPSNVIDDFPLNNKKYSKNFNNVIGLVFDREKFKLDAGLKYQNIILGSNHLYLNQQISPLEWKESRLGAEGNLEIKLWDQLNLNSHAEYTHGSKFGNFIKIDNALAYYPMEGFGIKGKVNFLSSAPSFNLLVNGSPYQNYNYLYSGFKNQNALEIGGELQVKWWDAKAFVNYFNIGNYAYLDSNALVQQSSSSLNISQIGGEATAHFNKFHLNARVMFQSAISNKDLLPMPNFIGRANFYYQNKFFQKVAEAQIGVKTYFFSKYNSREFSPILNEFILPGNNAYAIGGKPMIDAYINFKVKSMMFFVEAQHLDTTLIQNKHFVAPYYPGLDFRLNLGIVWYIFS